MDVPINCVLTKILRTFVVRKSAEYTVVTNLPGTNVRSWLLCRATRTLHVAVNVMNVTHTEVSYPGETENLSVIPTALTAEAVNVLNVPLLGSQMFPASMRAVLCVS